MPPEKRLLQFGSVPFRHGALLPLLADYRRPNDKIAQWLSSGALIQLQRGLYLLGDEYRPGPVSLPLVANLLYGPSCVSLDFALNHYGLIPEAVVEVTSVTPRRAREITSALGRFSYTRLPYSYYQVGVCMKHSAEGTSWLMASPAKALCDKVALTRNFTGVSVKGMRTYILEDLRITPESLTGLDLTEIGECLETGFKSRHLAALFNVVEEMQ